VSVRAGEKVWFTAKELAEMNLPGLSNKRNRVVEIATAGRWATRLTADAKPLARPRKGRGGGFEYNIDVLPPQAVLEIKRRAEAPAALPVPETVGGTWSWFEQQSDKVKTAAKHRLKVVQAVEAACRSGLGKNAAVAQVAAAHAVTNATVWNWFQLIDGVAEADRLPALAPRRKGGGVKASIDDAVFEAFKSYYLTPTARTYSASYYYTKRWATEQGLTLPNIKTLQRRLLAEVPREVQILKRQGVKALMETVPSQTRTVAGMQAMSCVNIDGHTIDVFVTPPGEPDAKPIRATLIAIQDIYSRKFLAWRMCGEESIFHTRLAIADMMRKWGLPAEFLMDNGRAFASKYLTSGVKTRFRYVVKETDPFGLLPALGIKVHFATPAHGQAKPVERGFGDLVKFIAMHPDCEGAYTGNRPDRKPHNYGSKALAWEQLSLICDEMIEEYNRLEDRDTEMAKGKSFDQVFFESYARSPIAKATPEQLRMALLEAKSHKADAKTGEIRMFGNRYHAEGLYTYAGKDVTIRFDPDNLHEPIHVYTMDQKFICEAQAIEAVGFLDTEAAKHIAKARADVRKKARDLVAAEGLLSASHMASMQKKEQAEPQRPAPGAVRLVRTRGGSAAAAQIITEGAPKVDRAPVIDRLGQVQALQQPVSRPRLTLFDGGLNPQKEPERPK
jgi:hypothetical protein